MPSWGGVAWIVLTALAAVAAVRLLLRERRRAVIVGAGIASAVAPLLWDLILRAASGRRVALTAAICGLAALLVDVYVY